MGGDARRRPKDSSPFWTERSWLVSALFLAGVVLMAAVVWLTGADSESTASSAPRATTRPMRAEPRECPAGPTVSAGSPDQPADLRWHPVNAGDQVPVSASQGPARTDGGVLRCFAHSPMGAVLAAHIIPVLLDGADWPAVADRQVLAGQGREILVAWLQASDRPTRRGGGSYAGFAVDEYSSTVAKVQLLVKGPGTYSSTRVELRWEGGDWKVAPSPLGAVHEPMGTVAGSRGFTLWKR